MWIWILVLVVATLILAAGATAFLDARRRRREYDLATRLWRDTPDEERLDALTALAVDGHTNGPAWYLIGCAHLRLSHPKQAARAFGIAHHADCNLETAALLTFACLKARDGEDSDIIEQINDTWHEMNEPNIFHRKEDRRILACLGETSKTTPPGLAPPEQLAWSVLGPAARSSNSLARV